MSNWINKAKLILWFAIRPGYWQHAVYFKLGKNKGEWDSAQARAAAGEWARDQATPVDAALRAIGLAGFGDAIPRLPDAEIQAADERAATSKAKMGGPAALDLVYAAMMLSQARRAVETGVAYGWSSLAILAAIEQLGEGRLVSVDMPYPGMHNENWVGVVVPPRLRHAWTLIRKPDRNGLRQAIGMFGGSIDFAHYDSDKSYRGRLFGYGLMWDALVPGGVFISDDIQDNWAFRDFIRRQGVDHSVVEFEGKYVGLCVKPDNLAAQPA